MDGSVIPTIAEIIAGPQTLFSFLFFVLSMIIRTTPACPNADARPAIVIGS